MKSIPNILTSLPPIKAGGNPPTYADLLNASLDFNPAGSWSLSLMKKRLQVSEKIAAMKPGDDMVELGDSDFETAKQAIADMPWNVKSAELVKFAEAFGL